MPELPEVETTRRGIDPFVAKKKIAHVTIRERRFRWPIPNDFEKKVTGHTVRSISRRAKYLLFELDHGYFMIHLGMSGSLRISKEEDLKKHKDFIQNRTEISSEKGYSEEDLAKLRASFANM